MIHPYMKAKKCYECGQGTIQPLAVAGRIMAYKTLRDLEVPATLEIPTCDNCGSEWINDTVAEAIDEVMEPVYRAELAAMAKRAIEAIGLVIQQKELEQVLGLSAGYISKIKQGERQPNPDLVATLCSIATHPERRLKEIRDAWDTHFTKKAG
jgi:hypothetical protein